MEEEKDYCVYTGSYPEGYLLEDGTDLSGIVFYVGSATMRGKTTPRFSTHESEARRGGESDKCKAIRAVWAQSKKVCWQIIFITQHRGHARAVEQQLIQTQYASVHLTNDQFNIVPRPGSLERALERDRRQQIRIEEKREYDRRMREIMINNGMKRQLCDGGWW